MTKTFKRKDTSFSRIPIKDYYGCTYLIKTACQSDSMVNVVKDSFYISEDDIEKDEMLRLIIAYLNLNKETIPVNWKKTGLPHMYQILSFGGFNVIANDRFNLEKDEGEDYNWLFVYALTNGLLLGKSSDDNEACDNIINIEVRFYDMMYNEFICEMPDLGKLFDSEDEFIDYIKDLRIKSEEND